VVNEPSNLTYLDGENILQAAVLETYVMFQALQKMKLKTIQEVPTDVFGILLDVRNLSDAGICFLS
jgi:hypothetical protein